MSAQEFYQIVTTAQVSNALFLIAAALVIIAFIMTVKFTSKKRH